MHEFIVFFCYKHTVFHDKHFFWKWRSRFWDMVLICTWKVTSVRLDVPQWLFHSAILREMPLITSSSLRGCRVLWWACLHVCLCVCPLACLKNHTSKFHKHFWYILPVAMACASSFVDNIRFSHNVPEYVAEYKTSCWIYQVDALVRYQTTLCLVEFARWWWTNALLMDVSLQEWCQSFDVQGAMLLRWSVKSSTRNCVKICVMHVVVCSQVMLSQLVKSGK